MLSADVALVTMVPGAEKVVMPSKTYSAMMAGQAVLAIAPEASDLVDTIKAAECGWWVEPMAREEQCEHRTSNLERRTSKEEQNSVEQLREIVEEIVSDPGELKRKQENARRYAEAHFSQKVLAEKWAEVVRHSVS